MTKNINGRELVFVEVPADGLRPRVTYIQVDPDVICTTATGHLKFICSLPMADYTTIGKASDLSEEQWAGIVENEFDTWLNYEEDDELGSYYLLTATESGLSLLSSLGMNPQTTLILIKEG